MNRLPSLFVSHGAPTFAIEPGLAGPRLSALGRDNRADEIFACQPKIFGLLLPRFFGELEVGRHQ